MLAETRDGAELASILLDIARTARYRASDRIQAATVLRDRCFGKVQPSDRPDLLNGLMDDGVSVCEYVEA